MGKKKVPVEVVAVLCVGSIIFLPIIARLILHGESPSVGSSSVAAVFGLVLLVAGLVLYLLPTWLAFSRRSLYAAPICVVNVLLGWTLIGWVAALAWALMPIPPVPPVKHNLR